MIPDEVLRDLSVAADIVNATGSNGEEIAIPWVKQLSRTYGMTYPNEITQEDCRALGAISRDFRRIFSMDETELADFANTSIREVRFSPRLMSHGGFGWHIHYYDEDFSLDRRIRSSTAMSIMSLIIHQETDRLKICKATDCGKVFVDTTRNASKVYCDVKTCGNRSHVANFRAKNIGQKAALTAKS